MNSLCLVMIIEHTQYKNNIINLILNQSEKNFQLLIICNNSKYLSNYEKLKDTYEHTDKISFLLQIDTNFGFLYNSCLQYFLNNNFTHLVLINSYDEYYKNFLNTLLTSNKDFVYGTYHSNHKTIQKIKNKKDLLNQYDDLCNSMWTKHAIEKIGYFDEKKESSALLDYYLRTYDILGENNIGYINTPLYFCKCKKNKNIYGKEYVEHWLIKNEQNIHKYVKKCHNECLDKIKKKQFFNTKYESSLSPNYIHIPNHNAYHNNKILNECNIRKHVIQNTNKLITFIICIKNRNIRTNICLKNLMDITKNYKNLINIIIVEEIGNDLFIDKFNILRNDNVTYIQLKNKSDDIFNRSHLLNVGIKNATTKYLVMYDCDFLVYDLMPLIRTLSYYHKHNDIIFRCSLYESENIKHKRMETYSYVWVYNKNIINKINFFNEDFQNWGFEEIDIASRILNGENKLIHIFNHFFHLSHDDTSRNKNNLSNNKTIFRKNIIIPDNLKLVKYNSFQTHNLVVIEYNKESEIFNDKDAIIYTSQSASILLINKHLFQCKIVGNIIDVPYNDELYKLYTKVTLIGFDNNNDLHKKKNDIGIITPMFNQNEDIYVNFLASIKKQQNTDYIHVIIDSFSKSELLYKFFENNNPQSLFIQKKSNITHAIKIGYKLLSKSVSYWSWLNSDDELYDENTLQIVKESIRNMEYPDILYGTGEYVKKHKVKNVNCSNLEIAPIEKLLTSIGIIQPSVYMKSNDEKIEKCLFELEENLVFDYELWIKLAIQDVRFRYIDINLSKYNFTNINITGNNRLEQLYQTCCLVKKYYGFVPLPWIKKYSSCKINNTDGIWNNRTEVSDFDLEIFIQEFNKDSVINNNINNDFIQNEFNKIKL